MPKHIPLEEFGATETLVENGFSFTQLLMLLEGYIMLQ